MSVLVPITSRATERSPLDLWRDYRRSADRRVRDRLLFSLAPLVRHAGAASHEDAAAGLAALLDAVEAYEPERDGALERFAWARVRAAL